MSSVLSLPIEQQEAIAKRRGLSHAAWVALMQKTLKQGEEFRNELDANAGVRPKGWTEEDTKRFQAKVDSGNPHG